MGHAAPAETDHGGHAAMDHGDHAGMGRGGHAGMGHGGHAGMGHGGHAGMGHGGHAGMDHGSMEVAGLPMADTAPDRDGLQLDALAVALGPVLPGWPTGLLLRGKLQGDVLTDVSLSWVDAAHLVAAHPVAAPPVDGHHSDGGTARLEALDHLARFLDVAGWPVAARDARRARSGLRDADPDRVDTGRRRAVQLARRVRRSRTLAWSVRGIGAVKATGAQPFRGDVLDRIRWWCELAAGAEPQVDPLPELPLERVAELLEGAELAAARLVVASLRLTRQETATPVAADVRTG
jgi:hypothetical protein